MTDQSIIETIRIPRAPDETLLSTLMLVTELDAGDRQWAQEIWAAIVTDCDARGRVCPNEPSSFVLAPRDALSADEDGRFARLVAGTGAALDDGEVLFVEDSWSQVCAELDRRAGAVQARPGAASRPRDAC